jgi:hypothetical protein
MGQIKRRLSGEDESISDRFPKCSPTSKKKPQPEPPKKAKFDVHDPSPRELMNQSFDHQPGGSVVDKPGSPWASGGPKITGGNWE